MKAWPFVAGGGLALMVGGTVGYVTGDEQPSIVGRTVNPVVTQANLVTTICQPGWTEKVRPPTSYTGPIKSALIAGLPASSPHLASAYELDHWIPLELGGAPADPANLVLQLRTGFGGHAEEKDAEENQLHRKVCSGALTLTAARNQIRADWPRSRFP